MLQSYYKHLKAFTQLPGDVDFREFSRRVSWEDGSSGKESIQKYERYHWFVDLVNIELTKKFDLLTKSTMAALSTSIDNLTLFDRINKAKHLKTQLELLLDFLKRGGDFEFVIKDIASVNESIQNLDDHINYLAKEAEKLSMSSNASFSSRSSSSTAESKSSGSPTVDSQELLPEISYKEFKIKCENFIYELTKSSQPPSDDMRIFSKCILKDLAAGGMTAEEVRNEYDAYGKKIFQIMNKQARIHVDSIKQYTEDIVKGSRGTMPAKKVEDLFKKMNTTRIHLFRLNSYIERFWETESVETGRRLMEESLKNLHQCWKSLYKTHSKLHLSEVLLLPEISFSLNDVEVKKQPLNTSSEVSSSSSIVTSNIPSKEILLEIKTKGKELEENTKEQKQKNNKTTSLIGASSLSEAATKNNSRTSAQGSSSSTSASSYSIGSLSSSTFFPPSSDSSSTMSSFSNPSSSTTSNSSSSSHVNDKKTPILQGEQKKKDTQSKQSPLESLKEDLRKETEILKLSLNDEQRKSLQTVLDSTDLQGFQSSLHLFVNEIRSTALKILTTISPILEKAGELSDTLASETGDHLVMSLPG